MLEFSGGAEQWDELIQLAPDYTFLQSYAYGNFQKAIDKEVKRWVFLGGEDNRDSVLLFQTNSVHARRGNILQLRHGPIPTPYFLELGQQEQLTAITRFLAELKQLGESTKADFIRLQVLQITETELGEIFRKAMREAGFRAANIHNIDAEKTLVLDINRSEDEILAGMRKQTRYYIRRAKKDGVEVSVSSDPEAVADFFRVHADTVSRQDFVSFSEDYYQKFLKLMPAKVIRAHYKGEVIAAAIVVFYGVKAFYSEGGSLTKYSKIPGSYAVQWRAIELAKEFGCASYNFWGGVLPHDAPPNYPWLGIDLFKRGFGGERVEYLHAQDLGLTWKYKFTRAWELLERKRRGY